MFRTMLLATVVAVCVARGSAGASGASHRFPVAERASVSHDHFDELAAQLTAQEIADLRRYHLSLHDERLAARPPVNTTHSNWMGDLMRAQAIVAPGGKRFAERTLQEIVLPGTHDSGAYYLTTEVIPGFNDLIEAIERVAGWLGLSVGAIVRNWGVSQSLTCYEQLQYGVRYLDLRPVWHTESQQWLVGHGTYGTTMKDLFGQIGAFLLENREEVVLIELAHLKGDFTDAHVELLALEVEDILGQFLVPRERKFDDTVQELVDMDKRLVAALFHRSTVERHPLFYFEQAVNNNFANTNAPATLVDWAPVRAVEYTNGDFPEQVYKISWTLTPDQNLILGSIIPGAPRSLYDLASLANPLMSAFTDLLAAQDLVPGNLVNPDFCEETDLMRLVIEANERTLP